MYCNISKTNIRITTTIKAVLWCLVGAQFSLPRPRPQTLVSASASVSGYIALVTTLNRSLNSQKKRINAGQKCIKERGLRDSGVLRDEASIMATDE